MEIVSEILTSHDCYREILDLRVTFDVLFAYGDVDRDGNRIGLAMEKKGIRHLGEARVTPMKWRAKGCCDGEILLDGDWWDEEASEDQKKALVDHELYHFLIKKDRDGVVKRDDLGRPRLKMRPHDFEMGAFHAIAQRHGAASQEVKLARSLMDEAGQLYWPEMAAALPG